MTAPAVRQRLLALEHRYPAYLLTSLLPVLLMPLASSQAAGPQRLVMPLVFTLLVLQSLRTLPALDASPAQRRWAWLFRLCGFGALVAVWLVQALPMEMVPVQHLLPRLQMQLVSLFMLMAAVRLLHQLALAPRVNLQVLSGAAAGYVHLGICGGVVATSLELLHSGTFSSGQFGGHVELLDRLIYMSYVTIASLGYGDVLPTNVVGQRFVILLSLGSTLYMSLIVGLVLGRYLASRPPEPPGGDLL